MPYFDHNATTPLAPIAREAWLRASEEAWQNPSSPYRDAARVKIRLDAARERLAELLGTKPEHVVFNSGATEGAHAVLAYWARTLPATARIAVNPTEHPCVLGAAGEFFAGRIVWLDVSPDGIVRLDTLTGRLAARDFSGVVVMAANNETGVIQPWPEIARLCQQQAVPYLCDASQWLGKLPAAGLGAAGWVIGAGHKFGAPKGVGFVKIPPASESFQAQSGGGQEHGHRGGTENYPAISAMVAALYEVEQRKVFLETERLRWRGQFEISLAMAVPGVRIVGTDTDRLWNTVSAVMPHTENLRWVTKLDKAGFQVSTGSACATGKEGPSHVLAALGVSAEDARRVIRMSAGWETTDSDWTVLATALAALDAEFRATMINVAKL